MLCRLASLTPPILLTWSFCWNEKKNIKKVIYCLKVVHFAKICFPHKFDPTVFAKKIESDSSKLMTASREQRWRSVVSNDDSLSDWIIIHGAIVIPKCQVSTTWRQPLYFDAFNCSFLMIHVKSQTQIAWLRSFGNVMILTYSNVW